jgi:hypothetical protein
MSLIYAFAYSFANMVFSFCLNFIPIFAASYNIWVEPIVIGGFITFLVSFIACIHVIFLGMHSSE